MNDLTQQIALFQAILQQPLQQRNAAFSVAFPAPLPVVQLVWPDGRLVEELVALHPAEVPALITHLSAPRQNWLAPTSPSDWQIRLSTITAEELTESSKKPGERAVWGTEKDIWRNLIDRLLHLKSADLTGVTCWVWQAKWPYPIVGSGLRYFVRESEYLIRDGDVWQDFPIADSAAHAEYLKGFSFRAPHRLAITHQNGLMQAFDTSVGFVGPDDFRWLRALPTHQNTDAAFEGLRMGDIAADQDTRDPNARAPITHSHIYAIDRQTKDVTRITPQGQSVLSNNAMCDLGAGHVISLLAPERFALSGPWRAARDGRDAFGPEIDAIKAHWWGFGLRDQQHPSQWWILPRGSGEFAAAPLDAMPNIAPLGEILVGSKSGLFGALDIHTGAEIIPFVHPVWEELMLSPEHAVVFGDTNGRFTAYDEYGKHLVGPLRMFELDKKLWPSWMRPFYSVGKDDAEKRTHYLRHDMAEMVRSARRLRRFGDWNPFAPSLAAYAGRFENGRKDADLCMLWGAPVVLVRDVEAYGVQLRKGQKGRVGFGDVAPYGGSSMFNWLVELPVEGLNDSDEGKVIGIPFDALRIRRQLPPRIRRLFMVWRRIRAKWLGRRG